MHTSITVSGAHAHLGASAPCTCALGRRSPVLKCACARAPVPKCAYVPDTAAEVFMRKGHQTPKFACAPETGSSVHMRTEHQAPKCACAPETGAQACMCAGEPAPKCARARENGTQVCLRASPAHRRRDPRHIRIICKCFWNLRPRQQGIPPGISYSKASKAPAGNMAMHGHSLARALVSNAI